MKQTTSTAAPLAAVPMHAQLQGTYHERLLRIDAVMFLTGLGRSAIYGRMASSDFPRAVRVHGRCVAWKETEVNAWIKSRPHAALLGEADEK